MKVSKEMFARWKKYVYLFMAEHEESIDTINSPSHAWTVAHRVEIPKEAYHVGLNDGHIETALKKIFLNAWP